MLEVCLNALFCKKLIDGRYVFPYISARSRQQRERQYGEVSEWLKEHAWKVCIRQRIGGSNPPHRHIRDESLYASTGSFLYILRRGMRTPDRGSTTGAASWTDRARSKRAAPTKTPGAFLNNACVGPAGARPRDGPSNGERSESIPLTAIFKMRACTQVRALFFIFSAGGAPREKPIPKLILLHPLILFAEVVHQRPDGGQQPAP